MTELVEPPRLVRIRAGDIVVEVEWPNPTTGSPRPVEDPPALSRTAEVKESTGLVDICAPTVGTFYRAPEPGAGPFVAEGDHVLRGQQIGIVEAMKLMIPLEAEHEGDVVAVLVNDGTPVEYGDPLFTFAPVAG